MSCSFKEMNPYLPTAVHYPSNQIELFLRTIGLGSKGSWCLKVKKGRKDQRKTKKFFISLNIELNLHSKAKVPALKREVSMINSEPT